MITAALGFPGSVHRSGSDGFQGVTPCQGNMQRQRSPRMRPVHRWPVKVPGRWSRQPFQGEKIRALHRFRDHRRQGRSA